MQVLGFMVSLLTASLRHQITRTESESWLEDIPEYCLKLLCVSCDNDYTVNIMFVLSSVSLSVLVTDVTGPHLQQLAGAVSPAKDTMCHWVQVVYG